MIIEGLFEGRGDNFHHPSQQSLFPPPTPPFCLAVKPCVQYLWLPIPLTLLYLQIAYMYMCNFFSRAVQYSTLFPVFRYCASLLTTIVIRKKARKRKRTAWLPTSATSNQVIYLRVFSKEAGVDPNIGQYRLRTTYYLNNLGLSTIEDVLYDVRCTYVCRTALIPGLPKNIYG